MKCFAGKLTSHAGSLVLFVLPRYENWLLNDISPNFGSQDYSLSRLNLFSLDKAQHNYS